MYPHSTVLLIRIRGLDHVVQCTCTCACSIGSTCINLIINIIIILSDQLGVTCGLMKGLVDFLPYLNLLEMMA